jgi:hypothetical protein
MFKKRKGKQFIPEDMPLIHFAGQPTSWKTRIKIGKMRGLRLQEMKQIQA